VYPITHSTTISFGIQIALSAQSWIFKAGIFNANYTNKRMARMLVQKFAIQNSRQGM